ncbi:MAG: hypothetical protein JWN70_5059 [Planctomycetaceae bacterium]|nr:hypothetical protein [Planctomycetaceae bacterium]
MNTDEEVLAVTPEGNAVSDFHAGKYDVAEVAKTSGAVTLRPELLASSATKSLTAFPGRSDSNQPLGASPRFGVTFGLRLKP